MEIKNRYKTKCPECEINWLENTDFYCCKSCYRDNPTARKKAKEFSKNNYSNMLLKKLETFNFFGFLHTTNSKNSNDSFEFSNFEKIYKSGFLMSRHELKENNIEFDDYANPGVIKDTSEEIKNMVRFYFRPKTPTNYSAFNDFNQKNPVMFVFKKDLIFKNGAKYCDGCAARKNARDIVDYAKNALDFNWEEIFNTDCNYTDREHMNYRNAEFLLPSPVSLDDATNIYFRNSEDYEEACKKFGQDARFELKPEMFY